MAKTFKNTIVIAMGGSLLIPDSIDISFLKQLKEMMKTLIDQNYQVALVIGGGKYCRHYQNAAREFNNVNDLDLDWIGIKTIHLNCELVIRSFSDLDVHENIVLKPVDIMGIEKPLIVVGAWEPGCSSDTDAVEIAENLNASRIINFSNTSHVYSEDPNNNSEAEKFETLSWEEYRKLIPSEWTPGLSAPFDPVASKIAQEKGITVAILGASIENLENYLNGEKFEGTIIS
ncbi:MAG: UMP kinase [Candidatus Pacebacteria bacterium]|nr:UMP kinase [Candidatus Paceibacterota bacterium]